MKSNNLFRDQVSTVTAWFKGWSECEQTVAMYSLLKQLSPLHCRFLVQVLDQLTSDNQSLQDQEDEANNPGYICNLSQLPKEKAIQQLLNHLLLLHSGNTQAKNKYLTLIHSVLSQSLEDGVFIEESRQLLSYSLIHPAISSEERSQFNKWLEQLEKRFSNSHSPLQGQGQDHHQGNNGIMSPHISMNNTKPAVSSVNSGWPLANGYINNLCHSSESLNLNHTDSNHGWSQGHMYVQNPSHPVQSRAHLPLQATYSAPANFNNPPPNSSANHHPQQQAQHHPHHHQQHQHQHHPQQQQQQQPQHAPLRRMPSYAPMSLPISTSTVSDWLNTNGAHLVQGPGRPGSVLSDHAPLSPQSSSASSGSGSDTHPGDHSCLRNTFMEEGSGMRDVPLWLKSLRLHKYANLFQQLTYEEMLGLNEEYLEKQNVTKGATNKILISVKKLLERQQCLRDLEKDIMNDGSVKSCIWEMKGMLNTPLKAYTPPGGVPSGGESQSPSAAGDAASNVVQEGDIPGQFMQLMTKVCTQLMLSSPYDDEGLNMYLQLIEKCINHEAFSQKQKKLLDSFKQRARQLRQPAPVKYYFDKRQRPSSNYTFPMNYPNIGRPIQRSNPTQGMNMWPKQNPGGIQWNFGTKRTMVGNTNHTHMPLHRNNSHNTPLFSRPSMVEQPIKQPVTRTQSAPLRSHVLHMNPSVSEAMASDTEINAQLDSLCRSVTECALGGMDGHDRGSAY